MPTKKTGYMQIIRDANLHLPAEIMGKTHLAHNTYRAYIILATYAAAYTETGNIPANFRDNLENNLKLLFSDQTLESMQEANLLKTDLAGNWKLTDWPAIASQRNARDDATRPNKFTVIHLLERVGRDTAAIDENGGFVGTLYTDLEMLGWSQEEYENPAIIY